MYVHKQGWKLQVFDMRYSERHFYPTSEVSLSKREVVALALHVKMLS